MSKQPTPVRDNTIVIDLDQWTTQADKARQYIKEDGSKGVSIEYICKLVSKGKLKSWRIPELNINLVER
jgi:hypothetical protein